MVILIQYHVFYTCVRLKKSPAQCAARAAATRLQQEVALRERAEAQKQESAEALAKTEALLAASTQALQKAREETRASRMWGMAESASTSEKDAKLAQKLGQFQPFLAVFLLECMGQLVYFGPT